ncbi:hypothetical protein FGSG_06665 [Fusarium graminearum PH-1]|uniref:Chromosome 4, complete genome n=1 Tax=Gibberella zeae (strain ATCC MYA-4620 / CBS 123657 / FGSC 9075 / NRRL 31084 / PH-1) TaxID=229533 RepID=I1RRE6_GIBZE|nr:hypothetical protein FGSG_06665 [Fusarium graminearum PH-1]ESU12787.1 hypothetical protein FGSG_06665 [Fusarium graminearum PH-1]EYB28138.1 hypothetical protein FG05_06665 [Fusarium graminearum]CEF84604.1 unnamed protein product [Fusarium graminearum]|eukprot:XP_011326294.1 hypothetical protein FGSG_06665 [Fusarium graminearum PH-1]
MVDQFYAGAQCENIAIFRHSLTEEAVMFYQIEKQLLGYLIDINGKSSRLSDRKCLLGCCILDSKLFGHMSFKVDEIKPMDNPPGPEVSEDCENKDQDILNPTSAKQKACTIGHSHVLTAPLHLVFGGLVSPASTKRLDNQRGRGEVGLDDGPLSLALVWVVL